MGAQFAASPAAGGESGDGGGADSSPENAVGDGDVPFRIRFEVT